MSKKQQLHLFKLNPVIENIEGTKFADGDNVNGKHYWLTPPDLMDDLNRQYEFDFDACPHPIPEGFNGLEVEWGQSTYVNPPFGSVMVNGKKKGPTAWARKCIEEAGKGKRTVMVYPLDRWILMLLEAGAKVVNLGDVKWLSIEDGTPGTGTGRDIACFILDNTETP